LFALCIVAVQVVLLLKVQQAQLSLLAVYTTAAVIGGLFIDKIAGAFLALIGVIIAFHILGLIPHNLKLYAGESLIILGVLACGWSGPSGGLTDISGAFRNSRRSDNVVVRFFRN